MIPQLKDWQATLIHHSDQLDQVEVNGLALVSNPGVSISLEKKNDSNTDPTILKLNMMLHSNPSGTYPQVMTWKLAKFVEKITPSQLKYKMVEIYMDNEIIFTLDSIQKKEESTMDIKTIKSVGETLESGVIPAELSVLKSLGNLIKSDPEKYKALREEILGAQTDLERINILREFVISEDQLRKMITGYQRTEMVHTIAITITIIIATWPDTAQ